MNFTFVISHLAFLKMKELKWWNGAGAEGDELQMRQFKVGKSREAPAAAGEAPV